MEPATPNPTERALAAIWEDILNVRPIDRSQNFFEGGGDSLLATKAVLRIRRTWPVAMTVRTIIDRPVLKDLAAHIDLLTATTATPSPPVA
ncbi:phosphopantetheine-binding protein [Streptomyces sp. NPDC102274]|uniref:phosphopantetheine-binding protein n=1 Tax=Streptomyces sp. NPDC102274 TaxID=3366151 RepID=UPI0037F92CF4